MVPFGFALCFPEVPFIARWIVRVCGVSGEVQPLRNTSDFKSHKSCIRNMRAAEDPVLPSFFCSGGVLSLCEWTAFTDASCKPSGNVWGWKGRGRKPGVFEVGSRLNSRKNKVATWCESRFWSLFFFTAQSLEVLFWQKQKTGLVASIHLTNKWVYSIHWCRSLNL